MPPLLKITPYKGYHPYSALLQPSQPHLLHLLHAPKRNVSIIRPPSSNPHSPPPSSSIPSPSSKPKPPRSRYVGTLLSSLTTFAAICAFISFIKENVFEIKSVAGESMYPFLNSDFNSSLQKDIVWVNKWRAGEDVKRGMVIAFWSPNHPNVIAVKRVIALEGDVVVTNPPYPFPREEVPVGHVWVEGDAENREKSLDSNYYGPVSKSLIEGKVTHIVWPSDKRCKIDPEDWKGSLRVLEGRGKVEKIEFY